MNQLPPAERRKTARTIARVIFFPLLIGLLVILGYALYDLTHDLLPSPIVYSESVYPPDNGAEHCPGTPVKYTSRIRVLQDADMQVIRTIRTSNVDPATGETGRRTAALLEVTDYFIVERGDEIQTTREFLVPMSLQPGEYVMLNSARVVGATRSARYVVPFTVLPLDECPSPPDEMPPPPTEAPFVPVRPTLTETTFISYFE